MAGVDMVTRPARLEIVALVLVFVRIVVIRNHDDVRLSLKDIAQMCR